MADNNKAVGALAAAKLVTLIKAETGKKYDKTGGKIEGSVEITGGLNVWGSSEFSSSINAGSEISSDMLLMAPIVALYDPATEESISFGVSGENAAKVTSPVSGGGTQYARLAVGTPTGDNDAATKAYVDNHAAGYEVITVTSTDVSDLGYDASEGANRYSVTFDASFDSILANLAANKPMKFNITLPDSTGGFPVSFSTGYVSALNDSGYLFTGTILKYPVVLSIGAPGSATVYLYGAYLPEPNPDNSDDGKVLSVNNHKWEIKAIPVGSVTVDAAMSDTSTNPVQNKTIKKYVDGHAVSLPLTITYANGQATGASYSDIRKAIESGRQIKLAVANTIDIIASNARNETSKSVLRFTHIDVGGDTVNIAQYNVTAQESGMTVNVKSYEIAQ